MEEGIQHSRNFLLVSLSLSVIVGGLLFSSPAQAKKFHHYQSYPYSHAVVFSPRSHDWKAISNGKVIRSGRASGGRSYCPDIHRSCRTPTGTYSVIAKSGPGCHSSRYPVGKGGAPMPYCMFFSKYYAIHGSPDVPSWNASHGCIRVPPSDARWLNHNFVTIGTTVVVKSY